MEPRQNQRVQWPSSALFWRCDGGFDSSDCHTWLWASSTAVSTPHHLSTMTVMASIRCTGTSSQNGYTRPWSLRWNKDDKQGVPSHPLLWKMTSNMLKSVGVRVAIPNGMASLSSSSSQRDCYQIHYLWKSSTATQSCHSHAHMCQRAGA